MSTTDKRKAAGPSHAGPSESKRVRIADEPSRRQRKREDTDFFDGDPEIEEQDLQRLRKDQKSGRIDDRGEDLSDSDDEEDRKAANLYNADDDDDSEAEPDAGSHRRRAQQKRRPDAAGAGGDDDDEDMFDVASDDDKLPATSSKGKQKRAAANKYLKLGELEEGQDFGSKDRSTVDAADDDAELLRGNTNDDDDLDPDLELEDEGSDEADGDDGEDAGIVDLNAYAERSPPTSPGGTPIANPRKSKSKKSKVKAPKVTGFNMKSEMRTGKFDADGNYHENQRDPHAQHDVWLAGNYSKSKILEARKAQQKRDQEAQEKEKLAQQDDGDEDQVKMRLVEYMHRQESVQRTLQRLGKALAKRKKATNGKESEEKVGEEDLKAATADVETVTHLSSVLMSRFGRLDIYDQTYEVLLKDVHKSGLVRQTFDPAAKFDAAPSSPTATVPVEQSDNAADIDDAGEWEYRWTPTYLAAAAKEAGTPVDPEVQTFGPFTLADLRSWADQGYFGESGERILLRPKGTKDAWMTYDKVAASH